MLLGVLLVAFGVAAAGPIAFVAFLSGPIARALNRGRTTLLGAGLVGALIVLAGDHAGAYALTDLNLPVGVVKVLLSDLVDGGHLTTRAAAPADRQPKVRLLQEVLDGLRARL